MTNWFLSGNFAPVSDERVDLDLEVTGAIPPELDGLLLTSPKATPTGGSTDRVGV